MADQTRYVRFAGRSMAGALEPGDLLCLGPVEAARVGDILVYRAGDATTIAHRVIARRAGGSFVVCGDACPASERSDVRPAEAIGRVEAVVRRGLELSPPAPRPVVRSARTLLLPLRRRVARVYYALAARPGLRHALRALLRPRLERLRVDRDGAPVVHVVHRGRTVAKLYADGTMRSLPPWALVVDPLTPGGDRHRA